MGHGYNAPQNLLILYVVTKCFKNPFSHLSTKKTITEDAGEKKLSTERVAQREWF